MRSRLHDTLIRLVLPLALVTGATALAGCGGGDLEAAQRTAAEQLSDREAAIAERERVLADREALAGERETRLAGVEDSLAAREATLERRAAELEREREALVRREAALGAREAALGNDRARIETERRAAADLRRETEARAAERRETERRAEQRERDRRAVERPATEAEPEPAWVEVEVAGGTLLEVEFTEPVSSDGSFAGDRFATRILDDVYAGDGTLAVPAGSELVGEVVEARPTKRIGGRARLELSFNELVLPSGKRAPVAASFYEQGPRKTRRDAATIGGGAVAGAILGRILDKDAAVWGAVVGAAAGTVIAAKRDGQEVEIPAGTVVTLQLDRPATVLARWQPERRGP